jgi:hypothetical protein
MKLIKKFSLLAVLFVTAFAMISCGEYQVLNSLDSSTLRFANTSNDLTDFDQSYLENALTNMSYQEGSNVLLLADDTETPLQTFIGLRKQIIDLHSSILMERTDIFALRVQIKDAVDYIKTNQIMLLDDDKATIQTAIDNLKALRTSLLDTQGQAYQKLIDLRGTYTRDNLDHINQVYTEVIPVLESRITMFSQATNELQNIYDILNDYYME